MEDDVANVLLNIAQSVVAAVVGAWLYLYRKLAAVVGSIHSVELRLDEKMAELAQRVTEIEQEKNGCVRRYDIERIWDAIRETQKILHEIKGRQESANRLLEELIQHNLGRRR